LPKFIRKILDDRGAKRLFNSLGVIQKDGQLDYKLYWDKHYLTGGDSGAGSFGAFSSWKADIVNQVISTYQINTVLEFGCGDGNQLLKFQIPEYRGLDVSSSAVATCKEIFKNDKSKSFSVIRPNSNLDVSSAQLVMSLEVLMHITLEEDYLWTLEKIFESSEEFVLIQAPLFEYKLFPKHSHEKYRDIFRYLIDYLDCWSIIGLFVHPSVSPADRRKNVIGEMSSDFILFKKRPVSA
jgi:SAM-dependent methyltransferase